MKRYPEWVKNQVRERIAAGETQNQLSKEFGNESVQDSKLVRVTPRNKAAAISTYA